MRRAAQAFIVSALLATTVNAQHAIDWHTIDGGSATMTGGSFEVSGTVGQPDAAEQKTGADSLMGGFWSVDYARCPADLTSTNAPVGSPGYGVPDGAVTVADIQYYVNLFVINDPLADQTTQGAGAGDPGFGTPDGDVTSADIQFYVNLFVAGCP